MALTPEEKARTLADLLFKQFSGKASSSVNTAFFEELVNSNALLFPSQLMAEEDKVPFKAKAVKGVVEEIKDLVLKPVPGNEARAFYHENLSGVIPFNYGDGTSYLYRLKNGDGHPIPFGQNDWFFNPHAGVLYFLDGFPEGVTQSNPPLMSCFRYIGKRGSAAGSDRELRTESIVPTKGQEEFFIKEKPHHLLYFTLNGVVQLEGTDFTLDENRILWRAKIELDHNDLIQVKYYL